MASLVLELVVYNPQIEMYAFNQIVFQASQQGLIEASIYSNVILLSPKKVQNKQN